MNESTLWRSFIGKIRTCLIGIVCFVLGVVTVGIVSQGRHPSETRPVRKETRLQTYVKPSALAPAPDASTAMTTLPTETSAAASSTAVLQELEQQYFKKREEDRKEILSLTRWEDFYEVCSTLGVPMGQLERLIFDRLQDEIQLSEEERAQVQKVFDEEQRTATEAVLRKYGRTLLSIRELPRGDQNRVWEDLRAVRENVRRTYDASYESVVGSEGLGVINRHLRNSVIRIDHTFDVGREYVLITGVGDSSRD